MEFLFNLVNGIFYLRTDRLMPSGKRNLTEAKTRDLMFLWYGALLYVQSIHRGLTNVLLCSPHSSLLTVNLMVAPDSFLYTAKKFPYFHSGYFDSYCYVVG